MATLWGPFDMRQTRKTAGTVLGAGHTDRTQFMQSVPPFGATPPDLAQPLRTPTIIAAGQAASPLARGIGSEVQVVLELPVSSRHSLQSLEGPMAGGWWRGC